MGNKSKPKWTKRQNLKRKREQVRNLRAMKMSKASGGRSVSVEIPFVDVINGGIIKREPEPEPLDDPDELWDNPGSEEERLSELPKTTDTCVDSIDFDYEQYKRPAPSTSSNSPKRMRSESLLAESLKEVSTNLAGLKEDAAKNQHMTKEELHDNFGRYVASLMRLLPMKKALMLQPKIVNMISSEILDCQDDIFD